MANDSSASSERGRKLWLLIIFVAGIAGAVGLLGDGWRNSLFSDPATEADGSDTEQGFNAFQKKRLDKRGDEPDTSDDD